MMPVSKSRQLQVTETTTVDSAETQFATCTSSLMVRSSQRVWKLLDKQKFTVDTL